MEVWAIEAYGAANVLQEILTVKSDDVVGRVRAYEAIVKGENIPKPSIPESFKVLIKEFQSLCLDIKVLDADGNEVTLSDDYDITAPDMLRVRNIGEDKFTSMRTMRTSTTTTKTTISMRMTTMTSMKMTTLMTPPTSKRMPTSSDTTKMTAMKRKSNYQGEETFEPDRFQQAN